MPLDFQILCLGAAATIDSALLLGLLEKKNRRILPTPVVAMLAGIWLFHCGEFCNLLLVEAQGNWAEQGRRFAMSAMATGLLLLPSSLFHAAVRLLISGPDFPVPANRWYGMSYLPLAILPAAIQSIVSHPDQLFLVRLSHFVTPYTLTTLATNAFAIGVFLWHIRSSNRSELRQFLIPLTVLLFGLTALLLYLYLQGMTQLILSDSPLLLLTMMAPVAPTLLFSYFVIRYRFMQLVLERTVVYGSLIAAVLLFHRLVVEEAIQNLQSRFQLDFGILEGVFLVMVIVLFQPARKRVKEAVRHLMGRSVSDLRAETRRLVVEMWQHVHDPPQALVDWFVRNLLKALEVKRAAVWLFDANGWPLIRSGDVQSFPEAEARELCSLLRSHTFASLSGGGDSEPRAIELLQKLRASIAVRIDHERISGLLVMGRRSRALEFGEEETYAVLLLTELLGATLHTHFLQAQRLELERAAAQNEKLATLGMLSSCLTHEIKNPLSSIKTIACVMSEQFGEDHPNSEDLRLIVNEVDRLSATTGHFLRFARPATRETDSICIANIIENTAQVLSSLAKEKGVGVERDCPIDLPPVMADENSARTIVFNLLLNAIEAAGRGGHVGVGACQCDPFIAITVWNDGPGIAPEVYDQLFTPFVTSKPAGTGLGLYIVRRTVEQLGGEISCTSRCSDRTEFVVKLRGRESFR